MSFSRRDFLKRMSAGGTIGVSKSLFPAWMPRLAFRQPSQAPGDVLVVIFLRGGIDGLSAVVPYGDGKNYYDARPSLGLPEPGSDQNAVVDLDGYFGFHQSLVNRRESSNQRPGAYTPCLNSMK